MLDVQRGDDADARAQDLLDVLVALRVAAAGGVGVGQLVDQGDGRPAGEHGVEVHLLQHDAAVLDPPARHLLQLADLGGGLRPAVRLDEADHHVDALPPQPVSLLEHVVGLADPGREAQVDLQPAALLPADEVEEQLGLAGESSADIGRWILVTGHGCDTSGRPALRRPDRQRDAEHGLLARAGFRTRPCRRGP